MRRSTFVGAELESALTRSCSMLNTALCSSLNKMATVASGTDEQARELDDDPRPRAGADVPHQAGRQKVEVRAVDGVDLDVAEGEVVGFLGPNGAGKTTTLRMLVTLLGPTAGTATVAGYDVVRESEQVRRSIGYVSQAGGTSARPAPVTRSSTTACSTACRRRRRGRRGQELFDELQLDGLWERMPKNMSGGQKRRLDIVDGADPRPDAGLPRRADHRARPAGPGQPVAAHRRPARAARRHGLPHHPLPRRGRRAQRPDHDHRPGPDRRLRHRRQPQGAGRPATWSTSRSRTPSRWPWPPSGWPHRQSARRDASRSTATTCGPGSLAPARRCPGLLRDLAAPTSPSSRSRSLRPTLDDVFLTLTGRSLRDAEAPAGNPGRPDLEGGADMSSCASPHRVPPPAADEPAQPGLGDHRPDAADPLPAAVRPAAQAADPAVRRRQRLDLLRARHAGPARHVRRLLRRLRADLRVARRRHRGRAGHPREPHRPAHGPAVPRPAPAARPGAGPGRARLLGRHGGASARRGARRRCSPLLSAAPVPRPPTPWP